MIGRPRRLLGRVYLFGLLLLLGAGAALILVGRLFGGAPRDMRLHISWIVDRSLATSASGPVLQKNLEQLQQELGIRVSVYDDAGQLLATTVTPALPPLPNDVLARLRSERWIETPRHMQFGIARFAADRFIGYALALPPRPEPPVSRLLLPMLVALVLVAAASIPFARSLTQPLERLAVTARRLGQGELRVRATIDRQDEVGDLARAFNEMAQRVEQLLRAEKELLANVSHELRTPLARIRVALELADSGEHRAIYLPEIAEDLAEVDRMIDDILTAARLDLAQGRLGDATTPLRLELSDARQVLARAVSRFSEHHPERDLVVQVPHELPSLRADPAMLRRVVDNLLENAHKYSNADRGIELHVRALPNDRSIEIVVRDEGIGIDAEDLPQVFTPFFRSDRSRARKTGGVGLGLPLARRIARAHGGDIELHSEVGIGTTATVKLPTA